MAAARDDMPPPIRSVCVYCGSSSGFDPRHTEAAQSLGRLLAANSIALVYGGASVGIMGSLADAALARGGRVVGSSPAGYSAGRSPIRG